MAIFEYDEVYEIANFYNFLIIHVLLKIIANLNLL